MHADQGEPSVSSGRGCDPHNRFRPMESPSTFLANMIRCRIRLESSIENRWRPTAVITCPVMTEPGVSSSWVPNPSRGKRKNALGFRISFTSDLDVVRSVATVIDKCGQATKGTWWMSWHREATKDVVACEKLRGTGKQVLIRRCLNRETGWG